MAYGGKRRNKGVVQGSSAWDLIDFTGQTYSGQQGGGAASVELVINANGEQYVCQSSKAFKEKFNIQQKLDVGTVGSNNGQFIKLTSSAKSPSSASFHNAKAILIKNISNITSEVYFRLQAWKNAGAASQTYDNEHASTELDGGGTSGNRYIHFYYQQVILFIYQIVDGLNILHINILKKAM